MLAGCGMGNIFINMCCIGMFYGLNAGLETLVSQAYGAGKKRHCGIYLQRSRVCLTFMFIPIAIVFAYSDKIMSMLG